MEQFDAYVAPRVGAWIETEHGGSVDDMKLRSHPVWVRGLKRRIALLSNSMLEVAPRVGAWIETCRLTKIYKNYDVAPRVGAWIETNRLCTGTFFHVVAPRVGAWIETQRKSV